MSSRMIFILLVFFIKVALPQGVGSGSDGNLRLCIVEGKGSYKRGHKYCPVLDEEKAGVECVLGTDRLDCLRRISKGTVDFGVFSPEDLVAAQWAKVEVLVTNEMKQRDRPFSRRIVAVVNTRILPGESSTIANVLRNTTLCYPVVDHDDLHPLSDTLARYLESLVTARSCDPKLSLAENRIKAMAEFFASACKAGQWVPDKMTDFELKRRYPSLCAACVSSTCSTTHYLGDSGALNCMAENAGDFTWADLDDVTSYFKLHNAGSQRFAYLCRDGSWQSIQNNSQPCVWLEKPWPVIVSKRKAAAAVATLTSSLTDRTVTVDRHWRGALTALLETHQALPAPLQPPLPPLDYLAKAMGFREAYSQEGCDPPRHITMCTTSLLENNKCEWLGEAADVYGVVPPLQCARRNSTEECLRAVQDGGCDVTVAGSDWLVAGLRDYSLAPILHEATPIIEKSHTIVAYVRVDAGITKMADLRGKRAAFPRFDGMAFHSVIRYIAEKDKKSCKNTVTNYFTEICAPGIEKYNVTETEIESFTRNCYKEDDEVVEGEYQALRSLVEGKSDVAFISMDTFNMYKANQIQEPWARQPIDIVHVCPEESGEYCFISWSNIGHIFAANNLSSMRRQEITNIFTELDQLFGKTHVHSVMFSMYGVYNHQLDVLFHNSTRTLISDVMYSMRPYGEIPMSFERTYNSSCQITEMTRSFASKMYPTILLLLSFLSVIVFS